MHRTTVQAILLLLVVCSFFCCKQNPQPKKDMKRASVDPVMEVALQEAIQKLDEDQSRRRHIRWFGYHQYTESESQKMDRIKNLAEKVRSQNEREIAWHMKVQERMKSLHLEEK